MTTSTSVSSLGKESKELGWVKWLRAWYLLMSEILFQKIYARHLQNPFPLPPLGGINFIVTGATSGIGLEISKQLVESGAYVFMAESGAHVEVMELDLLSLESVVKFSEAWNSTLRPLHILINNGGIFSMGQPQTFSKDGFETHLQVNHLAPAFLSILFLPSLQKGAPSRIVNMNSLMHRFCVINTSDMNFTQAVSLQKDIPKFVVEFGHSYLPFLFNAQEGSRSALFAATDPDVTKYCTKLKENEWPVCAYIASSCRPIIPSREAHNVGTSQSLWETTLQMVGLPLDAVEELLTEFCKL
ncbi:dehydrogenase [Lithospermum erythrorhizon]|uniref:Dehydrogenase n=1 Tax=Lithospermum erythrorhizon TaxID=34254 RepID=A0AAV3RJ07_LITER